MRIIMRDPAGSFEVRPEQTVRIHKDGTLAVLTHSGNIHKCFDPERWIRIEND